jgi:hypothetical protein
MEFLPASALIEIATGFYRDQCFWSPWTTFQLVQIPAARSLNIADKVSPNACRREIVSDGASRAREMAIHRGGRSSSPPKGFDGVKIQRITRYRCAIYGKIAVVNDT